MQKMAELDTLLQEFIGSNDKHIHWLNLQKINDCVKGIIQDGSGEEISQLIVKTFQIRDNGERKLFYILFSEISNHLPELARSLVKLVPVYGYWKDMWILWHTAPQLRKAIDAATLEQFREDQESDEPSLLAKWLPREKSKYDARCLSAHFAHLLFPLTPVNARLRTYRRTVANLNRILDTTEIKMCGKSWSSINPDKVPRKLLERCSSAFYNLKNLDDPDRIQCSENFANHLDAPRRRITDLETRYDPVKEIIRNSGYKDIIQ